MEKPPSASGNTPKYLWGGPPGPRPTPSSAFDYKWTAGPGDPARTGASAQLLLVDLRLRLILNE
jgi:hypothetical protein